MKRLTGCVLCAFFFLAPLAAQESAAETTETAETADPVTGDVSGETPQTPAAENEEDAPPPKPQFPNIINHVMDDDVIFETEPGDNAAAGDLYTLVRDGEDLGILLVNETQETFAVARVLSLGVYPRVGDAVRKTAGAGIEATFYGGSFLTANYSKSYIPLTGIRIAISRGFFYTRPVLEVEYLSARVHPDLAVSGAVPFNAFLGAEITNLYFGRFQLASIMLLGMSWAYMGEEARELFDVSDTFKKTHMSGKVSLALSFLAARHLKLTATAGFLVMMDTKEDLSDIQDGYFGRQAAPFITFGLTLK